MRFWSLSHFNNKITPISTPTYARQFTVTLQKRRNFVLCRRYNFEKNIKTYLNQAATNLYYIHYIHIIYFIIYIHTTLAYQHIATWINII